MADQTAPVTTPSGTPARSVGTPLAAILAVLTSVLGLIVLAWSVLYITKGRFLKHTFESVAGRMSEREIRVAGDFQFYFDPIDLKFRAEGLTVSNPAWAGPRPFFTSKLIDTRIATFASIFGKRRINTLLLDGASIDAEWDKTGKRNTWTFATEGEPFEMPIIKAGSITGTTVRYRDPRMMLSADLGIETVKARDTRFASAMRFSGSGSARGNPFTIS
ncbi:MAG TPA: AsmA family protein, partial [Sphingomicrobium sp.]